MSLPAFRPAVLLSRLLGAVLLCAASAGCVDQPVPDCLSSTAAYALQLIEQSRAESTPGACNEYGPATFNLDPRAGVVPYFPRNSRGQPDYGHGSLAIQTAELGTLYETALARGADNLATDGELYSLGDFTRAQPDAAGLCHVPELSATRLLLAELPALPDDPATAGVDESDPGQRAVDATLEWSQLDVYVSAASLGTQIAVDLVDTRRSADGSSCSISYHALGLAPAVPCRALDPENGAPLSNADGSPQPDPEACNPQADPAAGRVLGSGISPNTAYVCDPASAYCVLDSPTLPGLR